ncbi:hypothetical protein B5X24_HaOG215544 [Helicoverpa armigera]|nr:hypothetical protein B5X24_HaOG215544 [Helicoverpa armigera]
MSYVFYSILCLGMGVGMYLSQEVGSLPSNNLSHGDENQSGEYEDYDDTQEPQSDYDCYTEKISCTKEMNLELPNPVCVYKNKMGLTNYVGLCDIKLRLCLNKQMEQKGLVVVDEIYHNGKSYDCHYYLNNAKSEIQAVNWYFMMGGRDTRNENITAPIINKP